jgi:hypothetical protein
MNNKDFTTAILVDQSPVQAFDAICNVRGWWSENIDGGTQKTGDEFDYAYLDVHRCKIRLTEITPGKRIVWHVLDNYFNFIQDQSEWKDTRVVFDITEKDGNTILRLTHEGLTPQYECYKICHNAWTHYVQDSLFGLITVGKGEPNAKESE